MPSQPAPTAAPESGFPLAKPNYRQAKRQKELARKARQEKKLHRRSTRADSSSEEGEPGSAAQSGESGQPSSAPDT
jgi:hypothetical protein